MVEYKYIRYRFGKGRNPSAFDSSFSFYIVNIYEILYVEHNFLYLSIKIYIYIFIFPSFILALLSLPSYFSPGIHYAIHSSLASLMNTSLFGEVKSTWAKRTNLAIYWVIIIIIIVIIQPILNSNTKCIPYLPLAVGNESIFYLYPS